MTIYLFLKEDNIVYGYHTEEVEGAVPFETNKTEEEWEVYFSEIQSAVKLVNGKLETFEVIDNEPLFLELTEIYQWFVENDYIPNKIITGEWTETDKRWTDYLKERTAKRKRQDEIKALLGV